MLTPDISSLDEIYCTLFLSATEYHSDADYNSRRVGVTVVVIVVVVVVVIMVVFILKYG